MLGAQWSRDTYNMVIPSAPPDFKFGDILWFNQSAFNSENCILLLSSK